MPAKTARVVKGRFCLRKNCRSPLVEHDGPEILVCPKCGTFRRIADWEAAVDPEAKRVA